MELKWTKKAKEDLDKIFNYIFEDKPSAGYAVVQRIQKKAELLSDFPYIGTISIKDGTMETTVDKTSCFLIYKVFKKHISIIRVMHGATKQKPRY